MIHFNQEALFSFVALATLTEAPPGLNHRHSPRRPRKQERWTSIWMSWKLLNYKVEQTNVGKM